MSDLWPHQTQILADIRQALAKPERSCVAAKCAMEACEAVATGKVYLNKAKTLRGWVA